VPEINAAVPGIRQFLDLGSGLPSANNVHEVAQAIAPESRVVYVDHDGRGRAGQLPRARASHLYPELRAFAARMSELNPALPATLRGRQEVRDLFAGLDLVEPGVVQISRWRPGSPAEERTAAALWGRVARKP